MIPVKKPLCVTLGEYSWRLRDYLTKQFPKRVKSSKIHLFQSIELDIKHAIC